MPTRHRFDHALAEAANRQRRIHQDRIREAAIAKAQADAQQGSQGDSGPSEGNGAEDG